MDVNLRARLDIETVKRLGKTHGPDVEADVYAQFLDDMVLALLGDLKDEGVHPEILESAAAKVKLDPENVRKMLYR